MHSTRRVAALFAVYTAICAVIIGIDLINRQTNPVKIVEIEVNKTKPIKMTTVVVARRPLTFGTELRADLLREIPWPADAVPPSTFRTVKELIVRDRKRVILSHIGIDEPIHSKKITRPGERASLSTMLNKDMRAVTIRVNDVIGVGGFVLPGDRVDVLLTRSEREPITGAKFNDYAVVLLQKVRVLGIDQVVDDRKEGPRLARTATLEVDLVDAQKLVLGESVGDLSLALIEPGKTAKVATQRITTSDLNNGDYTIERGFTQLASATPATPVVPSKDRLTTTIGVVRALVRSEYSVPRD